MAAQFRADGVRFQYPENWNLVRDEAANGWTATLQSPATAFFLVTLDRDFPDIEHVADTVVEALRSEYPGMEADDVIESFAGQPALGHNISFFSLDLTNTCCTRCFLCEAGTLLVMWQANDLELESVEPVMKAICASLKLEDD